MVNIEVNNLTQDQISQVFQEYSEMAKRGYLAEDTLLRKLSEDSCTNYSLFLLTVEAVAKSVFLEGTRRYLSGS